MRIRSGVWSVKAFATVLVILLSIDASYAQVFTRHVRFELDASQLTAMQSGGLDIV